MNYRIAWTTQFKKDYKLAMRRHKDIDLLDRIVKLLARGVFTRKK